ncbi:MAG: hypothetical protein PQ612_05955 [Rickettsiales bacterium]|nr:hypothetical protein [Pseudomonadota bacterium]MDA0966867.1 hypothetical protein [Pseudomonadota bacterium]MDG4543542.1 hypothetical protein [Rickettsiales bacterium]MDG4545690.1 hypothetical protein [Rickettsiales bacterium]MDG4547537.1 hypothetical protein [Rickettsiales bacterium]
MNPVLNDLYKVRNQIIEEKKLHDVRLEHINALINSYQSTVKIESKKESDNSNVMMHKFVKPYELRDIAENFIEQNKGASKKELFDYFDSIGVTLDNKDPKRVFAAHLSHDKRFTYNATDDKWLLSKWADNSEAIQEISEGGIKQLFG